MGATAYPSPTATADNIEAGLRAREQAFLRGPNASPSHVPGHSGISIRLNSPTVAGAALAFIPIKRDSTSFPFNLTRTNDGQAPRQHTIMNRHPFFSTLPYLGDLAYFRALLGRRGEAFLLTFDPPIFNLDQDRGE